MPPLPKPKVERLGNEALLSLPKTAFLCSRRIPAAAILPCYHWAIAQREAGRCVVSGFHSRLEQDVFHYLVKGTQPMLIVLARGMRKKMEPAWEAPLAEGRLLIVSPFAAEAHRVNSRQAALRNALIVELAQDITIGYAHPEGGLARLLLQTTKFIHYLSHTPPLCTPAPSP